MTFLPTSELKTAYTRVFSAELETYVTTVKNYISAAITRHNTGLQNTLVLGLTIDYRTNGKHLYSAEDTTSPLVPLDYGLLKNMTYSVPPQLVPLIGDRVGAVIQGLSTLGYTVIPFWGYAKTFDISAHGVTEETFEPIRCYRIEWSNV